MILIKSALERSRGLSRCTLSHESSHDNDTKCRPRDLGPPRDGGALITILRARRATSARCYTSRCPRPAPSGSLLPRALSPRFELPFLSLAPTLSLLARLRFQLTRGACCTLRPIAVTAGRPLSSIAFAFVRRVRVHVRRDF